jgi:c-di-GMP-binding flagellar brake protein YcgR
MRDYIRHPSDIPIEVKAEQTGAGEMRRMHDISKGGLSFTSGTALPEGSIVRIRINLVKPEFEAPGRVVWCRGDQDAFVVGLEFLDQVDMFKARMVEQICHIEHYRKTVLENEGRVLSNQEAALEWIGKHAQDFPDPAADEPRD